MLMEKNLGYALASIAVVIVVAAGVYYLAGMFGGTEPLWGHEGHDGHEEGHDATEELLLAAIGQPVGAPEYTYKYKETSSEGYGADVTVSGKGGWGYVEKVDKLHGRKLYINDANRTLCLQFRGVEKCHNMNGTLFMPLALNLEALVFEDSAIERRAEHVESMMGKGGIMVDEHTEEKVVNGHNCTEVKYTLDYSKLTVSELRDMGLSPDDPMLLISKQYNYTLCIDPHTHQLWEQKMEYSDLGVPKWTALEVQSQDWEHAEPFEVPQGLVEEPELYNHYYAMSSASDAYFKCLGMNESAKCVYEVAVTYALPSLCPETGDKQDACYVNIGLALGDDSLCEMASSGIRDVCYYEFAYKFEDPAYCDSIANATMKEECVATVYGETECTSDTDCATAGCSGQLCVPSVDAEGTVTTCEYLPEYDCLRLTSCGCYDGKCQWRQTEEYLACMAGMGNGE